VRIDGKFFAVGNERFHLRGVTYGTFAPRDDGALFPAREVVKSDFAAIAEAGFTTVRTYTSPPEDVLELAADWDLRVLAGVFWPDWRYVLGAGKSGLRRLARDAREAVRSQVRRLAGHEQVLAVTIGNEVPADVLRWFGTKPIAAVIDDLIDVAHDEDPDLLVTYANYPTAEYLPLPGVDFLTFNVFLDNDRDLRRYLTRLHHLAGDRPLVLGELGRHVEGPDGEAQQAQLLDAQLEVALERGVAGSCVFAWTDEWHVGEHAVTDWRFGLTTVDREPRPALQVCQAWNRKTVRDLEFEWPQISVVVCAYNAAETIEECLAHTRALDYPGLEVLVVDDGSTDATADIAERICAGDPRMRVVRAEHQGLSGARNIGWQQARGDLIAYLDSDAYPTPEWPYYLALGLDEPMVGGVGGPNLPPVTDSRVAQMVARAPGGPVHVLSSDDRAEHIPGANMAFWRQVLEEVGGFDLVYTAAGDDVDLCWKVLDRDWEIGFHPAALVWHHRRQSVRAYLRQQRGYGRSEALVAQRHPDRFTSLGTARWHGLIYDSFAPSLLRQRVYRGLYGAAAYQSVYRGGGHGMDVAHQLGTPVAIAAIAVAPLALASQWLALFPAVAIAFLLSLFAYDALGTRPPRDLRRGRLQFRCGVAFLHLAQPVVRFTARWRENRLSRRLLPTHAAPPGPVQRLGRGVFLVPHDRDRAQLASDLVGNLRRAGLKVAVPSGWEDYDARLVSGFFLVGELVTSAAPVGCVQIRARRRVRAGRLLTAVALLALVGLASVPAAAGGAALVGIDLLLGHHRLGRSVRTAVEGTAP